MRNQDMELIDLQNNMIMLHFKYFAWGIAAVALLAVLIRRALPKTVTLSEIRAWAEKNKHLGVNCYVHKLGVLPEQIRKEVYRQTGLKKILNGYTDEGSVLVTMLDGNGETIISVPFMGNKLDEDLSLAIGEKGLNIKL